MGYFYGAFCPVWRLTDLTTELSLLQKDASKFNVCVVGNKKNHTGLKQVSKTKTLPAICS